MPTAPAHLALQPSCSPRCQQFASSAPVPRLIGGRPARRALRSCARRPEVRALGGGAAATAAAAAGQAAASATGLGLGDLADVGAAFSLGPAIGVGVLLAGLAGLRFTAYSQLEYITAAMLGRHVKPEGARVLQLGGSTRDLYYYPKGTVQVTVAGPDLKTGLWEQAGVQAQVPTVAKATALGNTLLFQPDASVDSVVLLNTLSSVTDVAGFCSEVFRVLRPGGTFVFVQRVRGGGLQPLVLGGPPAVDATTIDMLSEFRSWDYVQVDPALQQTDLHAAGVAIKPLRGAQAEDDKFSVDKSAFEQLMKAGSRGKGGAGAAGGSSGFGKK